MAISAIKPFRNSVTYYLMDIRKIVSKAIIIFYFYWNFYIFFLKSKFNEISWFLICRYLICYFACCWRWILATDRRKGSVEVKELPVTLFYGTQWYLRDAFTEGPFNDNIWFNDAETSIKFALVMNISIFLSTFIIPNHASSLRYRSNEFAIVYRTVFLLEKQKL